MHGLKIRIRVGRLAAASALVAVLGAAIDRIPELGLAAVALFLTGVTLGLPTKVLRQAEINVPRPQTAIAICTFLWLGVWGPVAAFVAHPAFTFLVLIEAATLWSFLLLQVDFSSQPLTSERIMLESQQQVLRSILHPN